MKKANHREKPPPLRFSRQEDRNDEQRLAMAAYSQNKQPLIVHTFSPEIIHTHAHDFMDLVQRLTGRAGHVSPLAKKPRLCAPDNPYAHAPDLHPCGAIVAPPPQQKPLVKIHHEQQSCISELALRRGLSPRARIGLQLKLALPPRGMIGPADARTPGGALVKSPLVFDFSPSSLPTPQPFLYDFPILPSPYIRAGGLSLPLSARTEAVCRSVMTLPAVLPSPGPLTSAFFAELPPLSPAAYSWIEKHPLSVEMMQSPLSRGFGLPPKAESANEL